MKIQLRAFGGRLRSDIIDFYGIEGDYFKICSIKADLPFTVCPNMLHGNPAEIEDFTFAWCGKYLEINNGDRVDRLTDVVYIYELQ